jgi:hypothetical protein
MDRLYARWTNLRKMRLASRRPEKPWEGRFDFWARAFIDLVFDTVF